MHHYDIYGGLPLPNCPFPDSSLPPTSNNSTSRSTYSSTPISSDPRIWRSEGVLHSPTVSLTYILSAVSFLILTIMIATQCEGVTVFNRRVRSKSVQNGWWSLWLFILSSRQVILVAVLLYTSHGSWNQVSENCR